MKRTLPNVPARQKRLSFNHHRRPHHRHHLHYHNQPACFYFCPSNAPEPLYPRPLHSHSHPSIPLFPPTEVERTFEEFVWTELAYQRNHWEIAQLRSLC